MRNHTLNQWQTALSWAGLLALLLGSTFLAPLIADEPAAKKPFAEHAVFLLDTSQSRLGDRFAADLKQLRKVLESDVAIKKFNIVTFDVAARWLAAQGLAENAPAGRDQAMKPLDGVAREGATDVSAALDKLIHPSFAIDKDTPVSVYLLSDGVITWGESDVPALVGRFGSLCPYPVRFKCYAPEEGQENLELFRALETLDWRKAREKVWDGSSKMAVEQFLAKIEPQVKLKEGKNAEDIRVLLKMLTEAECNFPAVEGVGVLPPQAEVSADYLKERETNRKRIATYLKEADRRAAAKDVAGAVRVLSSVVEEQPSNPEAGRLVGYRLLDLKQPGHAARLFARVRQQRPFEAHSYRDLARSLEDGGKFGLAALQYETVQAGTWQGNFTQSLKEVVLEEYAHMMRDAIRRKAVGPKLLDQFGDRLEGVDTKKLQADLRVTISWNTNNTDVDLWVIEPDGTKCYYAHQKTKNGGELTQDVTWGYGPERYQMIKAVPGEYAIKVHFYSGPRDAQAGETHVNVVVRRNAGTPQEVSQRFTVILRQRDDLVEVCRMKF